MKKLLTTVFPWLITAAAVYIVAHDIEWHTLVSHIGEAHPGWIAAAIGWTTLSYLLRARRWQFLLVDCSIRYIDSYRVLILGFLMNNLLPARAGEIVRAHLGRKVTHRSRASVLASIAAERVLDGMTLSLFFLIFATGLNNERLGNGIRIVALGFTAVLAGVFLMLMLRERLRGASAKLAQRFNGRSAHYTLEKVRLFMDGLTPLADRRRAPVWLLYSILIWTVELSVYAAAARAFGWPIPFAWGVFFMVVVNFSSLIPAAPGGIGVIEALGTGALIALGIEKELALCMVLTQHVIQYLVVGVPGVYYLFTWGEARKSIPDAHDAEERAAQGAA